jgi:hypothetical protein
VKFSSQSPLVRFDLKWIPVFRMVNQIWCELQVELDLTHQRTAELKAVSQGIDIHDKLHSQLFAQIRVTPLTPEDIFFIYLWNILVKVRSLQRRRISRELLIFGVLQGIPIMGCIDEVRLEGQEIQIRETKTRRSTSIPTPAQKLQGELQLHLYQSLLSNMQEDQEVLFKLLSLTGAQLDVPLSNTFIDQFNDRIPTPITSFSHKSLIKEVIRSVGGLPPITPVMELKYITQSTGEDIINYEILFDDNFLQKKLQWALEYWLGHRSASAVGRDKVWKCKFCVYKPTCPFLKDKE